MEWLTSIRKAIDYMEAHLEDDITALDVADQVFMSLFFFQKGFSLMTLFFMVAMHFVKISADIKLITASPVSLSDL